MSGSTVDWMAVSMYGRLEYQPYFASCPNFLTRIGGIVVKWFERREWRERFEW
jgi:hypothetical protein